MKLQNHLPFSEEVICVESQRKELEHIQHRKDMRSLHRTDGICWRCFNKRRRKLSFTAAFVSSVKTTKHVERNQQEYSENSSHFPESENLVSSGCQYSLNRVRRVINHFIIGFKACSTRGISCLVL